MTDQDPAAEPDNKISQDDTAITERTTEATDLQIDDTIITGPSDERKNEKKIVSMHAIKCKCGNILSRRMGHCPECGKNIEELLEELRQDFYRINFTHKSKKNNNT